MVKATHLVLMLALLAAACSSRQTLEPQPTTAPVPTTAVTPQATPPGGGVAETASPTPTAASTSGVLPELLKYPLTSDIFPDSIAIDASSGERPRIAIAGYRLTMIFEGPDQEPALGSPIADLPDAGFVSSIVSFRGQFLATVSDVDADADLFPPLFRWDVATEEWTEVAVTITRPSSGLARSAATPPSPPWEGASGVAHMAAYDDVLWATGWATLDGQVAAVLWRSVDGLDWTLETLPAIGEGTEYGSALAHTDDGMAVSIGNSTHFGAGIIARASGGQWFELPFPPDANGTPRLVRGATDQLAVEQNRFDGSGTLYRLLDVPFQAASDLSSWSQLTVEASPRQLRGWSAPSTERPIAWTESDAPPDYGFAHVWQATSADFETAPAPGNFVVNAPGWTVLRTNTQILLLPHS